MSPSWIAVPALCSLTIAACASGDDSEAVPVSDAVEPTTVTSMQAVGDSILEWNADSGESIPEIVGAQLGAPVRNNAVGGARMLGDDAIPQQYESGTGASHVLITGGGNDLAESCASTTTDALIAADLASGAMVDLADRIEADGSTTVIVGYYRPLPGTEFDCPEIVTATTRYEQFAESRADVHFVSTERAVTPDRPEFYADPVHPTPAGGRAVGDAVVAALRS